MRSTLGFFRLVGESMLYEILSTLESSAEALLRKVNLFFDGKIDNIPTQKGFQVKFFNK